MALDAAGAGWVECYAGALVATAVGLVSYNVARHWPRYKQKQKQTVASIEQLAQLDFAHARKEHQKAADCQTSWTFVSLRTEHGQYVPRSRR